MTDATTLHTPSTAPDYAAIKTRQQAVWSAGDYARIGVTLQIVGEQLCEAMDLRSGQTVLDVAAGNGNASLAAARRFCKVVSTDYVDALLANSARRAEAEGLAIDYQQADAENLPFPEATFDNVVSTYGVMFTPDQAQAAAELIRVCKPGGKIGLANWTPQGFIGQLFKTIGRYMPPPAGVKPPSAWGTQAFLEECFGPHTTKIGVTSRQFVFRYQSPQHWLDMFRTYYGPTLKLFEALDDGARQALRTDILALIDSLNRATDGTMVVPSEYLEVVITR
ncbi:Methyltransferase domain-containing protein [Modicisalibacter muralis]|uniref:Methyltransferase domain-containing protein n=1 Tax=Modicisalibacter muralis TaxID=119000 RepID=A0A1G9S1G1_9GAMM|nr:class I SAM-dependent methyltransferase [Halomonas muralis]SDM29306.1 Methyltransferase domain-containing protein [Halomonas muralis]